MAALVVTPHTDRDMRAARLARFDRQDAVVSPAQRVSASPVPVPVPTRPPAASTAGTTKPASKSVATSQKRSKMASGRPAISPPRPEEDDEEAELKRAIALSLGQEPAATASSSSATSASPGNALWNPPRYVPPSVSESSKELKLVESVEVRDGGYAYQPATAFLDTGNQHVTIVDTDFARRHALWSPDAGVFSQAERWTQIHGVVPGASTRAPIVTLALKIRGHEMLIPAAVSEMRGHDLLIGIDVLKQLFAAGFRISMGSV